MNLYPGVEPNPPPPMPLYDDEPWWRPAWFVVAILAAVALISGAMVRGMARVEERRQAQADACAAACAPAAPEFRRVGSRWECYCDATVRAP